MQETQRLRELRDSDRRTLQALEDQRKRATVEFNNRMFDLDIRRTNLERNIETWDRLINQLEENRAS